MSSEWCGMTRQEYPLGYAMNCSRFLSASTTMPLTRSATPFQRSEWRQHGLLLLVGGLSDDA
jgi:hypothetical protein